MAAGFWLAATASMAASDPLCGKDDLCFQNLTARQLLVTAEQLIETNQLQAAREILDGLRLLGAEEQQRRFLLGLLAHKAGDYDAALSQFRLLLADNPKLTRVRLEYARTLFAKKEDEAADYHFRLALADRPPPGVRDTVMDFRRAIRNRRSWQASFNLGLAPDTNLNQATTSQDYSFFSIPADRLNVTPPRSGLGFLQSASFSWTPLRRSGWALQIGGYDRLLLYRKKEFQDISLGGDIGVEVPTSAGRFLLSATGLHQWYGGAPYLAAPGLRLGYEANLSTKWAVGGQFNLRFMDYARNDDYSGPVYQLFGQTSRMLNNVSYIRQTLNVQRTAAKAAGNANWQFLAGIGYGREFSWGLTASAYIEGGYAGYDGELAAFSATRKDVRLRAEATLLRRNWTAFGFAPKLVYNFYKTDSNIGFFSYERHQTELVLSRVF